MKNIKSVGKILWPNKSQRKIVNLFVFSTIQASILFTIFAYGNLAIIMSPNPLKWRQSISQNKTKFDETSVQMVVKANQYMGLSDATLKMIEADLQN